MLVMKTKSHKEPLDYRYIPKIELGFATSIALPMLS